MGTDKYEQEFECSFHAPVEGAYYGSDINELEGKGRMTEVPYDDLARTYTAWDLGVGDSTAIIVCQLVGKEIRIIDCHENHGKGLSHYVNWIRDQGYKDATHLLPHDVQVRELGTGKSRLETLNELGLQCEVVTKLPVDDGIQAVRRILPRCWFDHKTLDLVTALRNYRRTYNEKQDVFLTNLCMIGHHILPMQCVI